MFRRRTEDTTRPLVGTQTQSSSERVTSVLGTGISWKGNLSGTGGVRIEGAFEGNISLRGLLVIGETGRVTGEYIKANTVIVAGAVRADITAEKIEIRATGRVWGNVMTAGFTTEEGAFLRGQITMEEKTNVNLLEDVNGQSNLDEPGNQQSDVPDTKPVGTPQETQSSSQGLE